MQILYSPYRRSDLPGRQVRQRQGDPVRTSHGYTRIYRRLFEKIRDDAIVLLEMGLLRPDTDRRRSVNAVEGSTAMAGFQVPSLEMWRAFFPRARIYGFDIDDFSAAKTDRCTIVRGDMSSEADLDRLVHTIGSPIDVVIDDASHASHHQQIAFGHLFQHLRSGGMYIVEDLHWQDEALERKEAPKTRDLLRQLQVGGALQSPFLTEQQRRYIVDHLAGVQLFDSLTMNVADGTDALAVLFKK